MNKILKRILTTMLIILFTTSMVNTTIYAKDNRKDLNRSPVISQGNAKSLTMKEDGASVTTTVNATDADNDTTLTWSIDKKAQHGSVKLKSKSNKAGTSQIKAVYVPKANYNGSDSYILQVKDSKGAVDRIKVNVKISPINDAPRMEEKPVISGLTSVGQILTTTNGIWNDDKDTKDTLIYSYQWQQAEDAKGASLSDLEGATSKSITLTDNMLGKWVRVTVTATDTGEGASKSLSDKVSSEWTMIEEVKTIDYVALGDSIATGTLYPGAAITPYVTNIYQYLQLQYPRASVTFTNLSANGARSNELFQKLGLSDPSQVDLNMIKALEAATLITISIGGNNLMQAAKDSTALGGYNFNKISTTVAKQGVIDFNDQWVLVMKKIKEINPTANIIVNTVFNPYNESDPLHKIVDSYLFGTLEDNNVYGINDIITNNKELGYNVADIYTAYDQYKLDMGEITYFNPDPADTMGKLTRNPHPNSKGQDVITDLVKSLLK